MSGPGRQPTPSTSAPVAPPRVQWPHGNPWSWQQLGLILLAFGLLLSSLYSLLAPEDTVNRDLSLEQKRHAIEQLEHAFRLTRSELLRLDESLEKQTTDSVYRQSVRIHSSIDQSSDSISFWLESLSDASLNESLSQFYWHVQRHLQSAYRASTHDSLQKLEFKKAAYRAPADADFSPQSARLRAAKSLQELEQGIAAARSVLDAQTTQEPSAGNTFAILVLCLAFSILIWLLIVPATQHRKALADLHFILQRLRVLARLEDGQQKSLDRRFLAFQKPIEAVEEDFTAIQQQIAALCSGQHLRAASGLSQRRPEFDALVHQLLVRLNAASDTLVEWKALLECSERLNAARNAEEATACEAWTNAMRQYLSANEALLVVDRGELPHTRWELAAKSGETWFRADLIRQQDIQAWLSDRVKKFDPSAESASAVAVPLFLQPALQMKELNLVTLPFGGGETAPALLLLLIPDSQLERFRTSGRTLHYALRSHYEGLALRRKFFALDAEHVALVRQLNEEKDRSRQLELKTTRLTETVDQLRGKHRSSEAFWEQALPLLWLDNSLRIVGKNELGAGLTQKREAELIGRRIDEVFIPAAGLALPSTRTITGRWKGEAYVTSQSGEQTLLGLELVEMHAVSEGEAAYALFLSDRADVDYLVSELRTHMELLTDKEQEAFNLNLLLDSAQGNVRHLRNALDNLTQALNDSAIVAETDTLGRIISVNEQFLHTCRYSREEVIGQNHRILKSGHQPDDLYENLWKTITQGRTWKGELKNRRKDGGYYWISTTITPIREESGEFKRFISVSFDITRRKLQEDQLMAAVDMSQNQEHELMQNVEDLRELQAMLRKAQLDLRGRTDAMRNAALVSETDLRGNIQHANELFLQAAGYSAADMANKNHRILKSGLHDDKFYHNMWKTIVSGEVWRGLVCNKDSEGRLYWLNLCITPVLNFDNQPVKYIAVSFDVTHLVALESEREQASGVQSALRESLERQESKLLAVSYELTGRTQALQAAAVVAEVDATGVITHANDRLLILARESNEELCGRAFSHYFHSSEVNLESPDFWNQLAKHGRWTGELLLTVVDSTPLWMLGQLHAVLNEAGQLRYYLCIFNDVTTLKKQEAEIGRFQAALNSLREELEAERLRQPEMPDVFPVALFRRSVSGASPFIWVGSHIQTLSGAPASQWLGPDCPWPSLLHPDDRVHVLNSLESARMNRASYQFVCRWIDLRGQTRFVREEGKPAFGERDELIHFDGVWVDVSRETLTVEEWRQRLADIEVKESYQLSAFEQLNQQLLEAQARSEALLQAGLVLETDGEGELISANDFALSRLEASRAELSGQKIAICLSPEHSVPFIREVLNQVANGGTWRGSLKLRSRSGSEFWCRAFAAGLQLPDTLRVIWHFQDMQREMEQERALRQLFESSQQRQREYDHAALEMEKIQELILENQLNLSSRVEALNLSAMVSETDSEGRITFVNDLALQTWGYAQDEAVGRRHNLIASDHHGRSFFAQMWRILTAGQVWKGQLLNRSRSGEYFWVQLTITPVLDGERKPLRYIGVAFDVTERVRQTVKAGRIHEAAQVQQAELQNRVQQVIRHVGGADARTEEFSRLPFPAAELDDRWRFCRANDAFLQKTGWNAAELTGESIALVLHAEQSSGASLDQLTQALSEFDYAYAELQYIDKGRNARRFATAFALQRDAEGPSIWMLLFDLERQLHAGDRQQSGPSISERMLERLTAHTLYFEMDTEGCFSFVHDRMLRMLGRKSESLLGKPFPVLSSRRTPVEIFEGLIHELNEGKTWYGSLEWVDAGGGFVKVIGAVAPIISAERSIERIVGIFVDYDRFDTQGLELGLESEAGKAQKLSGTSDRASKERGKA